MLLVGVVAGCAPPIDAARDRALLLDPAAQAVALERLAMVVVAVPSETNLRLDHTGPILDLGGGARSYARGVVVPVGGGDLRLVARSAFNGSSHFLPVITVLDAARRPVRSTSADSFRYVRLGFGETPTAYRPDFKILVEQSMLLTGEARERARFVVVHTTPDLMARVPAEQFVSLQRIAVEARDGSGAGRAALPVGAAGGVVWLKVLPSLL